MKNWTNNLILCISLLSLSLNGYSQIKGSSLFQSPKRGTIRTEKFQNNYQKKYKPIDFLGYGGVGFGVENLISAPKLGGFMRINFGQYQKRNSAFSGSSFYLGADGSLLIFFVGAFGYGVNSGIKVGPITIDNSYSKLFLSNSDGDLVSKQTSYNPKIGFVIGPLWLKFGPSFIVNGMNILKDDFGMNKFPFNAEILFVGGF